MVYRKFIVHYSNSTFFEVYYDTDDGLDVLKSQIFSLTSIPPDDQKILGGEDDHVVSDDSDLVALANELKLVSINDEGRQEGCKKVSNSFLLSDEELARRLQAEEEALMLQEFAVGEQREQLDKKLRSYLHSVVMYEDPVSQEAARKTVPVDKLEEKALVSLFKGGMFKPSKIEHDHAFLLQLLFWFKQSFRWVNAPSCDGCGDKTVNQGMGVSLPSESQYGASRVELYRCNSCPTITRFPRYNNPLKLVETRKGRCGEWANCFTLYCRAFGYQSRVILDFTDHLWTECFSPVLGRWMHLDPCEGVYDEPLLYEKGWGKKLNYVIAIAKDGVYDVTKRYTRNWVEVLSRRNIFTESILDTALCEITKNCRVGFTPQAISLLEDQVNIEFQELERGLCEGDDASAPLPGRQSGDKEWRISRSEICPDGENTSWSCSSFPVRVCVDEHVTRIHNAFHHLFGRFVENCFSKSEAAETLESFKGVFVDLRNSHYKSRNASVNHQLSTPFFLSCFEILADATTMKIVENGDGNFNVFLAGDPIKASLALPVVLDVLDDTILYINGDGNSSEAFVSSSHVRPGRIHSGSVIASGEQLPFGIATSAFDGLRDTKWEEPNGAKGAWIMYKVVGTQMHELVAYDLMSANDFPERDPMDWIVEGSDDGGLNWRILDRRTSQLFHTRFQIKYFEIISQTFPCDTFRKHDRFRFMCVKDDVSNSRLQLGNIDLHTSQSNS